MAILTIAYIRPLQSLVEYYISHPMITGYCLVLMFAIKGLVNLVERTGWLDKVPTILDVWIICSSAIGFGLYQVLQGDWKNGNVMQASFIVKAKNSEAVEQIVLGQSLLALQVVCLFVVFLGLISLWRAIDDWLTNEPKDAATA